MEDCTIKTEDIKNCSREDVSSGVINTEIFVAISEQIFRFPKLPNSNDFNLSLQESVTLKKDIVFNSKNGFFKIDAQIDTAEIKDELVGNRGNKKIKSSFEFFLSNTSARNCGFVKAFKNTPCIYIVKDKEGNFRVLGSKDIPVYFEDVTGTTGKTPEDNNGWQISITTTSSSPAPIYIGKFDFDPFLAQWLGSEN